jgi:hypothetical protein
LEFASAELSLPSQVDAAPETAIAFVRKSSGRVYALLEKSITLSVAFAAI